MMPSKLSPSTFAYLGCAGGAFVLAQVFIVSGWAFPSAGLFDPDTLVTVHLLVLGWLTLLIFGALYQFVPVIANAPLQHERLPLWILGGFVAGLLGMLIGFLGLAGGAFSHAVSPRLLPLGGALVVLAAVTAAGQLALTLGQSRLRSLSARYVMVGLSFLTVTVAMGLVLALALNGMGGPWALRLLGRGLPLHVAGGIAGWFTLTAMGVAYKLLAMFTLAPEERGPWGSITWWLLVAGFGLLWLSGVADSLWPNLGLGGLEHAGAGLAGIGVAGFLWDMRRLYAGRRRRSLELQAAFTIWALVALAVADALFLAESALGDWSLLPAMVYVLVFGWLSGLGLSQLYKIVPFLTWLERYGSRIGKEPVPLVSDLVEERRASPWFVLYFAAVALGTVGIGWNHPLLVRIASGGTLLATLMIGRELYRARYRGPGTRDRKIA